MSSRHTINLSSTAYYKLRNFGTFGETYSDLIVRLLNRVLGSEEEEK
jgi:hypothetical protein